MSDKSLSDQFAAQMMTNIERSMDAEMESLFGSPAPQGNLSIEELMETVQLLETPAQSWARDREACIKEDREKGRGTLVMNAEVEGVAKMRGTITEHKGIEYRVLIDEGLRGMRDKDGSVRMGYWVDPLPPLKPIIEMLPMQHTAVDLMDFRARYMHTVPTYTPIHCGVDVVDLGPTPMDLVSAELPRATIREQKRTLVYCWKASRLGISLKEYARQCKWGRAWLERKK
jgi:hypothetical protein